MVHKRETFTIKKTKKIEKAFFIKKGLEDLRAGFVERISIMKAPKFEDWMYTWVKARDRAQKKMWKEIRKQVPERYKDHILQYDHASSRVSVEIMPEDTSTGQ